ncbi:transporter family-2 protein [Hasllibacter halocynthiae]|uniref:Transporter family-2 protein n=1 Tax=Hasllibacter halocynthiae TaxID=595589 RepID=A0A2T0X198_9RHOB|nr:DMT family transporter [Hasllibacter halocynthiae]PRY92710.1 transporter family-2 protein [Hasllibacter halocynthiae]
MTQPPLLVALAAILLGGACIAVQAPMNARLAAHAGGPVAAAAVSFGVGFAILAAIALARGGLPPAAAVAAAPWWAWAGGALGAVYVWAAAWSVGSLGVVTLVAALIAGQMSAALVLDATGAFGLRPREVDAKRLLAVALVAAGVLTSRL